MCRNRLRLRVVAHVAPDTGRCLPGSSRSPPPFAVAKTIPAPSHTRPTSRPAARSMSLRPHRNLRKGRFAHLDRARGKFARRLLAYLKAKKDRLTNSDAVAKMFRLLHWSRNPCALEVAQYSPSHKLHSTKLARFQALRPAQ